MTQVVEFRVAVDGVPKGYPFILVHVVLKGADMSNLFFAIIAGLDGPHSNGVAAQRDGNAGPVTFAFPINVLADLDPLFDIALIPEDTSMTTLLTSLAIVVLGSNGNRVPIFRQRDGTTKVIPFSFSVNLATDEFPLTEIVTIDSHVSSLVTSMSRMMFGPNGQHAAITRQRNGIAILIAVVFPVDISPHLTPFVQVPFKHLDVTLMAVNSLLVLDGTNRNNGPKLTE
mmetsp:Transcript_14313/g.24314  ORF Transcript_14313/g.24314 Transcript_14313/m.24314 type:complete len:228 (-) Transcript_14313:234-917(-)